MSAQVDDLRELNLDGIVGPTHNYSGLAHGNLASAQHQGLESNPRAAALEGLTKMRTLMDLGLLQGFLPPQPRPNLPLLRGLGFTGDVSSVVDQASSRAPVLLAASYSASAMWTANSATVSPETDSVDRRTHLTPANLVHSLHRHQEALETTRILRSIFRDPAHFVVHEPLPAVASFSDEGAANHTRLYTSKGIVQLFAWGKTSEVGVKAPQVYPARQTLEASRAVARLHQVEQLALFWQQHPNGIDAGGFHTDVLAVGNGPVLLLHEDAFVDTDGLLDELRRRLGEEFRAVVATTPELASRDAVKGYAFNSQLVTLPSGRMRIIAPQEAQELPSCHAYLERVVREVPLVEGVTYVPVRQSMSNGGGPACLRLRVPLTPEGVSAIQPQALADKGRLSALEIFIESRYRDRVTMADLRDPEFARESLDTYHDLMTLLGLPSAAHALE